MKLVQLVVASSCIVSAFSITQEGCVNPGDHERRSQVQNSVAAICKDLCSDEDIVQDDFPECRACPSLIAPSDQEKVMDWSDLMSQQVALSSAHLRSMPLRLRRQAAATDVDTHDMSAPDQVPVAQSVEDEIDDEMEKAGLAPIRKKVPVPTAKLVSESPLGTKQAVVDNNSTTVSKTPRVTKKAVVHNNSTIGKVKGNATKVNATAPPNMTSVLPQASVSRVQSATNASHQVPPAFHVKPLPHALRDSSLSKANALPHRGYYSSSFPSKPSRPFLPDSHNVVQQSTQGINSYPGEAEEAADEETMVAPEQTQRQFLPPRLPQQQRQQLAYGGYYRQASGDQWGGEQQEQRPRQEQDPAYAAYFARRAQQGQVPNPSTLPEYGMPEFTDRVASGQPQFRIAPHPSIMQPEPETEVPPAAAQPTANPLDAGIEDLKKRVELQNKLAGMCVQRCKELGAYPMCTRCPATLTPVPQALSWNALFASMDGMGSWGRQQLAGLDHISLLETSASEAGCSAIDATVRARMQGRLAGLCGAKCRKAGSDSAGCLQCKTLTSPEELPVVLPWDELVSRMQSLAAK